MNSDGTVKSHQKISDTEGNFTDTLDDDDEFGISDTSLGDLDGDNVIDIAVGAYGDDDGGTDRGAVWVLFLDQIPSLVELTTFTATSKDGIVTLFWRTEAEIDNVGFAVYRSNTRDGDYTKIGFVYAAEDSETSNDYKFTDKAVEVGKTYFYYLEDIDLAGKKNKSEIIKVIMPDAKLALSIPKQFRLLQNYPNPFNPDTWLPYQLPDNSPVIIRIYDVKGRLIRVLNLGKKEAGYYLNKNQAGYWDGKDATGEDVSSGVYFYHLQAGSFAAVRKMVILK